MVKFLFSKKQMGSSAFLFFILISVLNFSGCKTGPEYLVKDYPSLIAAEDEIFISFNLTNDVRIVQEYLDRKNMLSEYSELIGRTRQISFSLPVSGNGKYTAVAEGSYPSFFTKMIINSDKSWNKHRGVYTWWENSANQTRLSIPISDLAVISNCFIEPVLLKLKNGERGYLPESVKKEMSRSAVVVYSLHPSAYVFDFLGMKKTSVRIEELQLSLIRESGESADDSFMYRIWGTLSFNDNKSARLFNTGLKLGLITLARKEGKGAILNLIKDNAFYVDENRIVLEGVLMNLQDIMDFTDNRNRDS